MIIINETVMIMLPFVWAIFVVVDVDMVLCVSFYNRYTFVVSVVAVG